MDDLIERSRAISAVNWHGQRCDCIEEIRKIPAVNRWISVHDVLPMEGMDVLVCNFDEWCGIASYHGDYWEDDEGRCVPAYAISHWQELPALPKKEG